MKQTDLTMALKAFKPINVRVLAVVNDSTLFKFNISNFKNDELKKMFMDELTSKIESPNDLSILEYSAADDRKNAIFYYDLKDDLIEIKWLKTSYREDNYPEFSGDLNTISAVIINIFSADSHISLYKRISGVEKLYENKRNMFFFQYSNFFEQVTTPILRLSASFQMFCIGDNAYIAELEKMERNLGFDKVITNQVKLGLEKIAKLDILSNMTIIENLVDTFANKKQILRIFQHSAVVKKEISNEQIIKYVQSHKKLQLHIKDNKINLLSAAQGKKFLKLLNDDYLYSDLTQEDYDVRAKDVMK